MSRQETLLRVTALILLPVTYAAVRMYTLLPHWLEGQGFLLVAPYEVGKLDFFSRWVAKSLFLLNGDRLVPLRLLLFVSEVVAGLTLLYATRLGLKVRSRLVAARGWEMLTLPALSLATVVPGQRMPFDPADSWMISLYTVCISSVVSNRYVLWTIAWCGLCQFGPLALIAGALTILFAHTSRHRFMQWTLLLCGAHIVIFVWCWGGSFSALGNRLIAASCLRGEFYLTTNSLQLLAPMDLLALLGRVGSLPILWFSLRRYITHADVTSGWVACLLLGGILIFMDISASAALGLVTITLYLPCVTAIEYWVVTRMPSRAINIHAPTLCFT